MVWPRLSSLCSHRQDPRHLWLKFSPVFALILTTAAALSLLILRVQGWRGSEEFARFIIDERTAVAISVQIISHLLGLLQLAVICAVIKLSFNRYAASHSIELSSLHFISAIYSSSAAWSLQFGLASLSIFFIAFTLVPAALWSGSITPLLDSRVQDSHVQAPTFQTSNVSTLWEADTSTATLGSDSLAQWQNEMGLFSFWPASLRGLLLSSASSASATDGSETLHAKLDKTGFVYVNRSYGVGSAAGLISTAVTSTPLTLSYLETGFESTVSCAYNRSNPFRLVPVPDKGTVKLHIFQTAGSKDFWSWYSVGSVPADLFAWGPESSTDSKTITIAMTTGASPIQDEWKFLAFDGIQCQVQLTMRNFNVLVNYTSKQINVTPADPVPWANYGDTVLKQISNWLRTLSYIDGFVGGSQLGRSLRLNVEALHSATTNDTARAKNFIPKETLMRGIADHVTSLVDDIIVALISTRFIGGRKSAEIRVKVSIPAVVYGDLRYIIAIFVFNILILLLYLIEAIRTRLWESLPEVDIVDISSLVVGIVRGDVQLVDMSEDKEAGGGRGENDIKLVMASVADRIEGSKERLVASPE